MKRMRLLVRDKNGLHWSFAVHGTQESLDAWQEAGLDVREVVGVIPERAVDLGIAEAWCSAQDSVEVEVGKESARLRVLWSFQNPCKP
jgi:hypothetical protein